MQTVISENAQTNIGSNNISTNSNNPNLSMVKTSSQGNTSEKNLKVKTLVEYLLAKNVNILDRLYNYNTVCVAVYRNLTEMARQLVIRLLFLDYAVPCTIIGSWSPQKYAIEQKESDTLLKNLNIWRSTTIADSLEALELTPTFKRNLKIALIGGGVNTSLAPLQLKNSKPRDIEFLDNYAMTRWRCVLHFLVGINNSNQTNDEIVSPDAVKVLMKAGLMRHTRSPFSCVLTHLGFQFLLLDTQAQVWHFMLLYVDYSHSKGFSLPDCLALLLQLGTATLGRDYSSKDFSIEKLKVLQHLREFGFVYQKKRKHKRFYPTRLAIAAIMHASAAKSVTLSTTEDITNTLNEENASILMISMDNISYTSSETVSDDYSAAFDLKVQLTGFLIVETNYRVYAHTDSELHMAVLGLFTELLFRFPRFVICQLSRQAMRQAFRVGITAQQIITYLEKHAHPSMRRIIKSSETNSVIPENIIDQINIWEMEGQRFSFEESVIFTNFLSYDDFTVLRDYAQSLDGLMWQNESTLSILVTQEAEEDVTSYWIEYSKDES